MSRALIRGLAGALAAVALLACEAIPAIAQPAPTVRLHASFTPDRLGASTTIGFSLEVLSSQSGPPPPLIHMDLRMPAGMNYLNTTLGLAICQPKALIEKGLSGCSPNARLGYGSAFVEVPFGTGSGHEIPNITALMGPPHNNNIVVLFYADGRAPVYAQLVFEGELLPGSGPFGGDLSTAIPLIPSVPNGPPVSIVKVESTIGPNRLTYYKRVHGRLVGYRPQGISIPERCPRGGFPFTADFEFQDGSTTTAKTAVPCPARHRRHK